MPKTMTIAELKKALAAKERQLTELVAKRQNLAGRLAAVDGEIKALGGGAPKAGKRRGKIAKAPKATPARRPRKLPRNPRPLPEYIKDVLSGSKDGMRVKDVMPAVKKAGYKTFSKDFYGVVATALREGPFVKVSRGVYRLKAAGKARAKKVTKRKAAKKRAAK